MMIKTIKGADLELKKLIYIDSVRADYLSTCERFTKGYVNNFITDMQRLITKLGIMIAKISNEKKPTYCFSSINFLCCNVLDNPNLVKTFDKIGLNNKGNNNKHDIIDGVKIDMLRCVTAYNNLVASISEKYNLHSLTAMIVKKNTLVNKKKIEEHGQCINDYMLDQEKQMEKEYFIIERLEESIIKDTNHIVYDRFSIDSFRMKVDDFNQKLNHFRKTWPNINIVKGTIIKNKRYLIENCEKDWLNDKEYGIWWEDDNDHRYYLKPYKKHGQIAKLFISFEQKSKNDKKIFSIIQAFEEAKVILNSNSKKIKIFIEKIT